MNGYMGASSFTEVQSSPSSENRSGISLTPRRRPGSAISSPLLVNGRNTPRRDTYTPIRRDSQDSLPRSPPRSTRTEDLSPPTLFPSLNSDSNSSPERWFNSIISKRKLLTGVWTGIASYFILLTAFAAIQSSFWAPIQSIINVTSAFFSPKIHIFVLFAAALQAFVAFLISTLIARVDQNKRASLTQIETWIAFTIAFGCSLLMFVLGYLFFYDYSRVTNEKVFHFIFLVGTAIATAVNIFSHDFQLLFGGLKIKSMTKNSPIMMIQNIAQSTQQAATQGVKVLACSTIVSVFLVPIFFGFSELFFIFNVSGHYALMVSFTAQVLIGHVFHRTLRQKLLEPINFNFLPPYNVIRPTVEQERNIGAVLTTNDALLKLFAMYDLRFIAWFDPTRRSEIFILSQPAGNPKNWKSVYIPTVQVLEDLRVKIDDSKNKLITGNQLPNDYQNGDQSDEEEYINRNMLMMPPSAREQLYSAQTRNRHQTALKPKKKKIVPVAAPSLSERIARCTLHSDETGIITRFEAEITIFALEALDMIVIASFVEDRFGIVQQDLVYVIRSFLSLHTSIDRFLRIKGSCNDATGNESLLRGVEDVLISSIARIGEKFSSSIKSLGLTNVEWSQFEGIVSQSVHQF